MIRPDRPTRWAHRIVHALGRGLSRSGERERLGRLQHTDAGHGYDVFGMHPDWLGLVNAVLDPVYRYYFRVEAHGAEHLPAQGGAILVANHSGTLPLDGLMLCMDVYRHTEPPRVLRPIADRFVPRLPLAGVFMSRLGVVSGARANVRALLEQGELVLIFPEGAAAVGKKVDQRYRLQGWRVGHVELALRFGVPVIPVAIIGPEEQWPVVAHITQLRPLGLPYVPVPATPLPLPVHYHIHYGQPIDLAARSGARDLTAAEVAELAQVTHDALQALIAHGLATRPGVL